MVVYVGHLCAWVVCQCVYECVLLGPFNLPSVCPHWCHSWLVNPSWNPYSDQICSVRQSHLIKIKSPPLYPQAWIHGFWQNLAVVAILRKWGVWLMNCVRHILRLCGVVVSVPVRRICPLVPENSPGHSGDDGATLEGLCKSLCEI